MWILLEMYDRYVVIAIRDLEGENFALISCAMIMKRGGY